VENDTTFWDDLRKGDGMELRRKWMEHDLRDYTWDIVRRFIDDPSSPLEGLGQYTLSGKFKNNL